jgi:hypothetical protein
LKLKCDELLSRFAFNFNLRHYTMVLKDTPEQGLNDAGDGTGGTTFKFAARKVGRCKLNQLEGRVGRDGLQLMRINNDELLSGFAFINVRHYSKAWELVGSLDKPIRFASGEFTISNLMFHAAAYDRPGARPPVMQKQDVFPAMDLKNFNIEVGRCRLALTNPSRNRLELSA